MRDKFLILATALLFAPAVWAQSEPGPAFHAQRAGYQKIMEAAPVQWDKEAVDKAQAVVAEVSKMDKARVVHQKDMETYPGIWWKDWATRQPYDAH